MKKTTSHVLILILLLQCSLLTAAASANTNPSAQFSDKELDELLGPIALYPDPLLAQVVPAATFVDQLVQANQVLKGSVNEQLIQKQTWDVSVNSVAHYPPVLEMMAKQHDWTTAVGQGLSIAAMYRAISVVLQPLARPAVMPADKMSDNQARPDRQSRIPGQLLIQKTRRLLDPAHKRKLFSDPLQRVKGDQLLAAESRQGSHRSIDSTGS